MKKKSTVLDRAAAALAGSPTSAEAEELVRDLSARIQEVGERIRAIAPPPPAPPARSPGYGRDFDPLKGAGAEYARVALHGTPAEMIALEEERAALEAEELQLLHRRDRLKEIAKTAKEREQVEAAPAELKKLAAEVDDRIERAERAIQEAMEAIDACSSWVRAVEEQQKLIGKTGDVLNVEQFRRLGLVLRHRVIEMTVHEVGEPGSYGSFVKKPALFNSRTDAMRAVRSLLPAPNPGLISKIKDRFASFTSLNTDTHRPMSANEHQVRQDLDDWHRARLDLIAAGQLEEAGSLQPTPAGSQKRFQAAS